MIDIRDELRQNAVDYAYEVNSQRAFPSAEDGLKPSQRASLWEMYISGYLPTKPHVKCAKIAGSVIGHWHPHGEVAVYEAFARMSMPWVNNIPEVDWHGANGNVIIGNAPASQRYTEARLSNAALDGMLQGLKKNNVDMQLNFSEDEEWPVVLPALFPRLLVNGAQGVGYSLANLWLPQSLTEVVDKVKQYLSTGEITYDNIYPDFPTGGIIINKDEIHKIYETGKGRVVLRGKAEIKGDSIFITELPYLVFVEPLIGQIKELVEKEEILYIKDILNKSDRKNLLIEIECERGKASIVLAKLFEATDLQKTYNANQYALVKKVPQLLNLKEYFNIYIEHNLECIKREYEFDLNKAKERLEIVLGLIKALEDIDNIIALIKKADSSKDAQAQLIKKYAFTENQAKAIINMKLGKLAHLGSVELNQEKEELTSNINSINNVLGARSELIKIFLDRLDAFTAKYKYDRHTQVIQLAAKQKTEEKAQIPCEDVIVNIYNNNTLGRESTANLKVQKRRGKGTKANNESLLSSIAIKTNEYLMLFSNLGKMYRLLVNDIPESQITNISDLLKTKEEEKIIAASASATDETKYIIFFTRKGLLKKTSLDEFRELKRGNGVTAIKLAEDDSIANAVFMNDEDVFVITKNGMGIQFETKDIKAIGRNTSGVKMIKLAEDDEVVCGIPSNVDNTAYLAFITENGYGKKISLTELFIQGRGGKGLQYYKVNNETGRVVSAFFTNKSEDKVLLSGLTNSICLAAHEIPVMGRYGLGANLTKNYVVSATLI